MSFSENQDRRAAARHIYLTQRGSIANDGNSGRISDIETRKKIEKVTCMSFSENQDRRAAARHIYLGSAWDESVLKTGV